MANTSSARTLLRRAALALLRPPHARWLQQLSGGASVLDVGCGNHSPTRTKQLRPDISYVGADIQEYNLDAADRGAADELLLLPADGFARQLEGRLAGRRFDLIYLKHVLEHSPEPRELLAVLPPLLKEGGCLFISFPSEASIGFPAAAGTLNFFDDPTHIWLPSVREVLNQMVTAELRPVWVSRRYHHPLLAAAGVLNLGLQYALWPLRRRLVSNTMLWALFGFESIVVLRKSSLGAAGPG
jgi:2-polyprenyl-3-methyl-5-hydroxy-6-metoxy-1,4-benzoquinol methylase